MAYGRKWFLLTLQEGKDVCARNCLWCFPEVGHVMTMPGSTDFFFLLYFGGKDEFLAFFVLNP